MHRSVQQLAATRGTDHPGVLTELALLSAMVGRFHEARGLNEHARRILVDQQRVRRLLRFVAQSNATVELLAGEIAAAEGELRTALEFARETWERDPLSQIAARLASVLRTQGRSGEAASFGLLSEQAAPSESVAARALSLAAKARSTSDGGDHQAAERLAREAARLAPRSSSTSEPTSSSSSPKSCTPAVRSTARPRP